MDSLLLSGIHLNTKVGVPDTERSTPQELSVDVELFLDLAKVSSEDHPKWGIDYDDVIKLIAKHEGAERKTIERLADEILTAILDAFPQISGAKVSVWKYTVKGVKAVCCTKSRSR